MSEWLVGKKAVANALGVSVCTVKRYMKRYPDFPANRRGGTIYVSPEVLRAWVEHREVKKCPMCGMLSHSSDERSHDIYCNNNIIIHDK